MLQFGASLTDNTRSVKYNCNTFMIQATDITNQAFCFVLWVTHFHSFFGYYNDKCHSWECHHTKYYCWECHIAKRHSSCHNAECHSNIKKEIKLPWRFVARCTRTMMRTVASTSWCQCQKTFSFSLSSNIKKLEYLLTILLARQVRLRLTFIKERKARSFSQGRKTCQDKMV